jgi:hypothetical protein
MTAAKHCDECQHWYNFHHPSTIPAGCHRCVKGHNPRRFQPRHPEDHEWGWKRICEDFKARKDTNAPHLG